MIDRLIDRVQFSGGFVAFLSLLWSCVAENAGVAEAARWRGVRSRWSVVDRHVTNLEWSTSRRRRWRGLLLSADRLS